MKIINPTLVRIAAGRSREQVAADGGMSITTVRSFEKGRLRNPSLQVIQGLARGYGIAPPDVIALCTHCRD